MTRSKKKKRSHAQFSADGEPDADAAGVGATLNDLQGGSNNEAGPAINGSKDDDSGEWQTVGKNGKRHKRNNYPSLVYDPSYRMQSLVKLGDLQSLVLYCLADGTSPQWVGLKHHSMIKRAVVLYVPGLERDMFDGTMDLDKVQQSQTDETVNASNDASTSIDANVGTVEFAANTNEQGKSFDPDSFLPSKLECDQLPAPLKPLAQTFSHVWPVKAPGDDRFGRIWSPPQAMLQSPLSRTQEQKKAAKEIKGPNTPLVSKDFENKRTRIAEFVLTREEMEENAYVLHPTNVNAAETETYFQARAKKGVSPGQDWVDSLVYNYNYEVIVPEEEIEAGSILAGRRALAMDCEMCKIEGNKFVLTRISLVDWNGEKGMDELVKPEEPIVDYLTE